MELCHRQLRSHSCSSLNQFPFPLTMQWTVAGLDFSIVCDKHYYYWAKISLSTITGTAAWKYCGLCVYNKIALCFIILSQPNLLRQCTEKWLHNSSTRLSQASVLYDFVTVNKTLHVPIKTAPCKHFISSCSQNCSLISLPPEWFSRDRACQPLYESQTKALLFILKVLHLSVKLKM